MTLKQPIQKKIPTTTPYFNLWLFFIFIGKESSATWFKYFYRLIFLLSFFFFYYDVKLKCRDKQEYVRLHIYLEIHECVFDTCLLHLFHVTCYH